MQKVLPKGTAAIIGEPSMMKTVTGHKSGRGYWIDVWGHEVHSSILHTGINAIMEAAKIIAWENEVNAEQRAKTPSPIAAMFVPPWTTLHTGLIEGGTAANITAKHCRFDFGFRAVPDETLDDWHVRLMAKVAEVEAEMKAVVPETRIDVTERFSVPGLRPETEGAAEEIIRQVTGDNATHVVSYGTEAGHFQSAGYSAAVCGPGDIAQAHQPDEFITIAQFEAGAAFMDRLVTRLQEV